MSVIPAGAESGPTGLVSGAKSAHEEPGSLENGSRRSGFSEEALRLLDGAHEFATPDVLWPEIGNVLGKRARDRSPHGAERHGCRGGCDHRRADSSASPTATRRRLKARIKRPFQTRGVGAQSSKSRGSLGRAPRDEVDAVAGMAAARTSFGKTRSHSSRPLAGSSAT
jgi:hypothetical protein